MTPTPLSAARVEYETALRPRGGSRRAARVGDPCAGTRRGRRAGRPTDAALIDAADAAQFLAREQDIWSATQILSHGELADLAVEEVTDTLVAEADRLPPPWSPLPRHRATRHDLEGRLLALHVAAAALRRAHGLGLLHGD